MPEDAPISRVSRRPRRNADKSTESAAVASEVPDVNDELSASLEKVRRARKSPSASTLSLESLTKSIQEQDAAPAPVRRARRRAGNETQADESQPQAETEVAKEAPAVPSEAPSADVSATEEVCSP